MDEMTYLAAHAPADIPDWFEPSGVPKLPVDEYLRIKRQVYGGTKEIDVVEGRMREVHAKAKLYRDARVAQWPWHWAGMVLAARPLPGPDRQTVTLRTDEIVVRMTP